MRGVLGFVSLLLVLAVIGLAAKSQLHAAANATTGGSTAAAAASAAGLAGSDRTFGIAPEMGAGADPTLSDAQRIKQIQQQAAEGAAKAMQSGTERNDQADQAAR